MQSLKPVRPDHVKPLLTPLAHIDQPRPFENLQMLGYSLLGDVEVGGNLSHRARFMTHQPEHCLSARLSQCSQYSLPVGHLLILPVALGFYKPCLVKVDTLILPLRLLLTRRGLVMPVIKKATAIKAPAEMIFAIIADLERIPEYAPGVDKMSDVRRSDKVLGDSCRVTYSLLGLRMDEKITVNEYEPPEHYGNRVEGPMSGTQRWRLEREGDGVVTRAALEVDYQLKGGALGKLMDRLLLGRMNEKNVQRLLENVKVIAERQPVAT